MDVKPHQIDRDRFTVTGVPDGSTLVTPSIIERKRVLIGSMAFTLPAYGILIYAFYGILKAGDWKLPALNDPISWVGIALILTGLFQIISWIWQAFGREEWQVSTNEFQWRGMIFGRSLDRCYRDGKFLIRRRMGSSMVNTYYTIYCLSPHHRRRKLYLTLRHGLMDDLATLLSSKTGWQVERKWEQVNKKK